MFAGGVIGEGEVKDGQELDNASNGYPDCDEIDFESKAREPVVDLSVGCNENGEKGAGNAKPGVLELEQRTEVGADHGMPPELSECARRSR